MTKPRILICSESSKIGSGFGVYNKYLIEGLWKTNKYEVAEFAAYGLIGDKEKHNIPWRYYPNAVLNTDPLFQEYSSSTINQFGKWRFDKVVADFRPHIVIDVRDYWMSSFEEKSPFRRLFHWILMPTIDSYPQQEEWLDTYINADAVFTYSDWGRDILKKQTNNTINFIDTASPCADTNFFKPYTETGEIKKLLGLDTDATIIGTVMRNQKRKLYPELIAAFEKVILKLKESNSEKHKQTILYLHTSYPDQGWDMANLIKNSRFGNKIYFTYMCKKCGTIFASNLNGFTQNCKQCNEYAAVIPNVSNPIDTSALGKIMSVFDMYIQYSICEGFGMPQVEAAYCGVPVLTVNYSAMTDMVNKINAIPINIGSYFKELETSAIRVYPSEDSLVDNIIKLIQTPSLIRKRTALQNLDAVKQHYSWDKTISSWINYIDTININKYEDAWIAPKNQLEPIDIKKIPNTECVYEAIYALQKLCLYKLNIKMSDYWILKHIHAAQNGFMHNQQDIKSFNLQNFIDILNQLINHYNISEQFRTNKDLLQQERFLTYGHS